MKFSSLLVLAVLVLASLPPSSTRAADPRPDAAALVELARAHEQTFRSMASENVAVVLQKGEKQFTIYGVTRIRAIGGGLEITVKNGEKYSVSPADVFFITNNGFKI